MIKSFIFTTLICSIGIFAAILLNCLAAIIVHQFGITSFVISSVIFVFIIVWIWLYKGQKDYEKRFPGYSYWTGRLKIEKYHSTDQGNS